MIKTENFEQLEVTNAVQLRDWLATNHAQADSIWLVTFKKSQPDKYVDRFAVLDELLCFGWIDGIRRVLDDHRTMQMISPRQTQAWSQSYKVRAARLEDEGRMQAPGRAAIATSKANGMWHYFDDVDALIVPDDLQAALEGHPPALENWASFSPSSRRNMLRLIKLAKTQKTREKRILQTATLAAAGQKVPQT